MGRKWRVSSAENPRFEGHVVQRTICIMSEAAKEAMPSGFGPWNADPALVVSIELAEYSRQGFATKNPILHLGQCFAYSRTSLGLPICCSKTAPGPAVAANNGTSWGANGFLRFQSTSRSSFRYLESSGLL